MLILVAAALAADPFPASLHGSAGPIVGPGAYGGIGAGRLVINFEQFGIEGGGREGYVAGTGRQVGNIGLGLRLFLPAELYVRVVFSHNHEVPWDTFTQDIGGSLLGVGDGIIHRSGVEAGLGWQFNFEPWIEQDWLGYFVELDGIGLFDDGGPRIYGVVESGFYVNVGKRRE